MVTPARSGPAPLCPHCGYDVTGLPENRCPECGGRFEWPAESAHAHDRAAAFVAYARDHDVVCRHCKTNLRGVPTNQCPGCGATYMLASARGRGGGNTGGAPWVPRWLTPAAVVGMLVFAVHAAMYVQARSAGPLPPLAHLRAGAAMAAAMSPAVMLVVLAARPRETWHRPTPRLTALAALAGAAMIGSLALLVP